MIDPKITIGIPTYNRASTLSRAVESALQQEDQIEVLISDNASTDATRDVCEEFARRHARVRYLRQPFNRGAHENFLTVLDRARGPYFMWLGDDDWLDAGYVRACGNVLDRSGDHVLVGGLARYFAVGEAYPREEDVLMVLEQDSPFERVLTYFSLVGWNGIFYGLHRHDVLRRFRAEARFGWDWSLVAALAFVGKVTTLQTVHINRQQGQASSPEGLNALHGISGFFARPENHSARLAWEMYLSIAKRVDMYGSLSVLQRNRLALEAANAVISNKYGSVTVQLRARLSLRSRVRRLVSRLRLVHGP